MSRDWSPRRSGSSSGSTCLRLHQRGLLARACGRLTLVLLTFGIAASAGNLVAGALSDRLGSRRVVAGATTALTVIFALTPLMRGSVLLAVLAILCSGFASFSVTTPRQHALIALTPDARSNATALYRGVAYAATSLAGALGAVALDLVSARRLTLPAANLTAAVRRVVDAQRTPRRRLVDEQALGIVAS